MLESTVWRRAVDAAIVALITVTVLRFFFATRGPADSPPRVQLIEPGVVLSLPGVAWAAAQRHVVLLAATSCAACQDGTVFYRTISNLAGRKPGTQFIVVSSQPKDEIRRWLADHAIDSHRIVHVNDPSALGYSVSPTLLFVDARGVVTDVMLRRLSPSEEAVVVARLLYTRETRPLNNAAFTRIHEADLRSFLRDESSRLLDIRARGEFARKHRDGAVNIPRDELAVRARAELNSSSPVAIDCSPISMGTCHLAALLLRDLGFSRAMLLTP